MLHVIAETALLSIRQTHFEFPGCCKPKADLVDDCYLPVSCHPWSPEP